MFCGRALEISCVAKQFDEQPAHGNWCRRVRLDYNNKNSWLWLCGFAARAVDSVVGRVRLKVSIRVRVRPAVVETSGTYFTGKQICHDTGNTHCMLHCNQ
jgi:hypothetical protein